MGPGVYRKDHPWKARRWLTKQRTAVNPTIHHELMKTRIADLHRHAARDRMARAAARARRARTPNGSLPAPAGTVTVLARVMIAALGARSPQQEPQ
jgi:hypothetical protein